jgi:hypothetical protein
MFRIEILTTELEVIILRYIFLILRGYWILVKMNITQLAFQAGIAQNLIWTNYYKVHNLNVTNEWISKIIDEIWDSISVFQVNI